MRRFSQNTNEVDREGVNPMLGNTIAQCEPLIGAEQAAGLLSIHPKTLKRLAAEGRIPAMKIGKLWRFRASALDTWMKSQIQCGRHPCPFEKGSNETNTE
jgi:excisionase family DNA binding protein